MCFGRFSGFRRIVNLTLSAICLSYLRQTLFLICALTFHLRACQHYDSYQQQQYQPAGQTGTQQYSYQSNQYQPQQPAQQYGQPPRSQPPNSGAYGDAGAFGGGGGGEHVQRQFPIPANKVGGADFLRYFFKVLCSSSVVFFMVGRSFIPWLKLFACNNLPLFQKCCDFIICLSSKPLCFCFTS